MERRKVQLIGGTTFSVSLPKAWAVSAGLRSGTEVEIEPEPDGTLTVRPHRSANATRECHRLDVRGLEADQVHRRILALYLNGMDLIEVVAEAGLPPSVVAELEDVVRHTSGLEIVEQTPTRVLLQDMLDPRDVDVPRAFLRVYGISSSMHRDILGGLAGAQPSMFDAAEARRRDVDRLAWVATRQVRFALRHRLPDTARWHNARDTLTFASAIALAQRLGSYASSFAASARNIVGKADDPRIVPGLVEVGNAALYLCDVAARALYNGDAKAADEAFTKAEHFDARQDELQRFASVCALKGGTCAPCFGTVQVLAWLNASVIVARRMAELAVQRAFSQDQLPNGRQLVPGA